MNGLIKRRSLPDSMVNEFSRISNFFNDFQGWLAEDDVFKDFFCVDKRRSASLPKLDVKETDGCYTVIADVAGLDKSDIKIEAHDNHVVISGEKKNSVEENGDKYIFRELSYRKFSRVLPFKEEIDKSKVTAEVKNGMLIVDIKKQPRELPTPVNVEVK